MGNETSSSSPLAMDGGSPVLPEPPKRDRRWGERELKRLTRMVEQESLFYWKNDQTEAMFSLFREHYPLKYLMPCNSCSSALHIAVAALGVGPGDEVIIPAITDMGCAIGILFQQGVPVFVDIDPDTFNLDPADVEAKITKRTKAIIAVHLNGNPCDMDALLEIAKKHEIVLIEDCAQAWGALYQGRAVGTMGDLACYSFDDFKHLSSGDGGIVGTNRDDFGMKLQPFGDKGYNRMGGPRNPTILAANYRMSEPQAAVAAGQLEILEEIAAGRAQMGAYLDQALAGVPELIAPKRDPRDRHSYWFYTIKLDLNRLTCDRDTFVKALVAENIAANDGSFPSTTYQWAVFPNHAFFDGRWPLKEQGLTDMDYSKVVCPNAEKVIKEWFRLILFEGMDKAYLEKVVEALEKVVGHYSK